MSAWVLVERLIAVTLLSEYDTGYAHYTKQELFLQE